MVRKYYHLFSVTANDFSANPGTQIDVLWFPEGAGGDRFVEKAFKGPLARMTREALDYIQRNYLHETVIKQPQRA